MIAPRLGPYEIIAPIGADAAELHGARDGVHQSVPRAMSGPIHC